MKNFDVIVIGAGGIGSAATYYLAQAKQRVLLLEQFELNHSQGSSYGYSRVIRYAYDNPIYIDLMREAYPLWFALQEAARETLYVKTGELDFGFSGTASMEQLANSMRNANLPYERLSADEVKERFPQFKLSQDMEGLYQENTGLLKASKCVLAHLRLGQKNGAIIKEKTPVIKIKNQQGVFAVKTARETFFSQHIILAAGSWTKKILAEIGLNLPLEVMLCQLGFFRPNSADKAEFAPGKFPIFLAHLTGDYGEFPYGIPISDHEGVKFSTFYGWPTVDNLDNLPEISENIAREWVKKFRSFLGQYLSSANGKLITSRRCLYTMTPDKHFIIDRHPQLPNLFLAAGFSGHGFKFTTLVGKILADWIIEGKPNWDLSLFKLSRFSQD